MNDISDRKNTVDDVSSVHIGISDRLATLLVGWPLTLLLSLWCLFMLALWVPNYLTWPWFADHDHFAMIAQSWSQGRLPYRDTFTNQFPGEIYVFRLLGEWTGWGNSVAFYAVDAALVLLFGVLSILWSLRRFGRILPGLIGFDVFLTYYLSQNITIVGQREWQGTFLATAAFFAIDLLPGHAGRILSGLAVGLAMSIHPQFILLAPGMLLAISVASQGTENRWKTNLLGWAEWCVAAGLMLVVAFLPLILNGLFPDFIRCLRSTSYGAGLTPSLTRRAMRFISILYKRPEIIFSFIALMAVTRRGLKSGWAGTWTLIVLQLSTICFGVLSPENHPYYQIPIVGFLGISCAYLSGLLLSVRPSTAMTLSCLILLIGAAAGVKPKYVMLKANDMEQSKPATPGETETETDNATYGPRLALTYLTRGQMPLLQPAGRYEWTERYPWRDYRAVIEFIRDSTTPETPVANLMLECITAVTGAIPRISPLPCDTMGLRAFPSLLQGDLDALESTEGCVVIWDPTRAEGDRTEFAPMFKLVREKYHREARFGNIEVWRRNVDPPK